MALVHGEVTNFVESTQLRTRISAFLVVVVAACGPRPVSVTTAPSVVPAVSVEVTNTLNVPVNIYLVVAPKQVFLGQVASNSTVTLPVAGYAPGATVTLRAVLADGTRQFDKSDFVLSTKAGWRVP